MHAGAYPGDDRSGVDSLKIEGRMKSIHYVATVVNAYRQVIDAYWDSPETFVFKPEWREEIMKAANRPLTTGFYFHQPTKDDQIFGVPPKMTAYDFAGLVLAYDEETGIATIEQRNHFKRGQEVEFIGPGRERFIQRIGEMWDEDGNSLDEAPHPMQKVLVRVEKPVKPYDLMRKEKGTT